ncbi:hypothetical protein PV327_009635 [Microctonus hyperodae]|uniref:chitinase n=1 Tax=Microctonus hyperodae TaxID=165561 RepID=A0AA39CB29_MICHY|nr:hypothetical protein PV327_009635 [Microctonus hyperodae]
MRGLILFTAVCFAPLIFSAGATEKKIVCYFGSWSVYRPGNGKFDISYIDPWRCTHLIYTFVGLSGNNVKVLDAWQDLAENWGKNGFGRFNALREKNPALKTLVAIGGWKEGSTKYSQMVKTAANREQFAANVVKFVKKYNFDGFDIDWEYPAQRGGASEDVNNFIELLKVMRKYFDNNNLILSAAVASSKSSASQSYKIAEMSKYLDFINVMSYDLHGAWEPQTGINAPLYPATGDNPELNVKAIVKYWLNQGCPKEKLILGVPTYGRTFTLADANSNRNGAPTRGPGMGGPYTREPGMLGYNEICEKLQGKSWTVVYDKERRAPYAYNGVQWIGYDNVASIKEKAEFIKKLDLGGAMVWSIETDDFRGVCGEKYPILKTLNAVLRNDKSLSSKTLPFISTTSSLVTVQDDENESDTSVLPDSNSQESYNCTAPGLLPKPNSCDFISCVDDGRGGFVVYEFECQEMLCFNPDLNVCDWKEN